MSREIKRFRDVCARALRAAGVGRGDGVVVACSHGPDSLALADAVLGLRRQLGLGPVRLVYVDHGLRPEVAPLEAEAVRGLAAAHGVEAQVVAVTVDRAHAGGLEEAARLARYAALEDAADAAGARWILTGHTASDQAETFVARLLRGAGPVGLAGIPPTRGRIVRPLLALSRADVSAYLEARRLRPSHDATNDEPTFLRNRVRHRVLPVLRAENPSVEAALARAAAALREMADALDAAVDDALDHLALRRTPAAVRVHAPALARLHAAVAKRLLARLAADLGASLEATHLDAARALAAAPAAGTKALAVPGLELRREYEDLVLERRGHHGARADISSEVQVLVTGADGPYRVRSWRAGDRMRPARLRGRSRKLKELWSDLKVPAPERRRAVVVVRESDGEIVWAEHVGPAHGSSVQVSLTRLPGPAITE